MRRGRARQCSHDTASRRWWATCACVVHVRVPQPTADVVRVAAHACTRAPSAHTHACKATLAGHTARPHAKRAGGRARLLSQAGALRTRRCTIVARQPPHCRTASAARECMSVVSPTSGCLLAALPADWGGERSTQRFMKREGLLAMRTCVIECTAHRTPKSLPVPTTRRILRRANSEHHTLVLLRLYISYIIYIMMHCALININGR